MPSYLSGVLTARALGRAPASANDDVSLHPALGNHGVGHTVGVATTRGEAAPGVTAGFVYGEGEYGGRDSLVAARSSKAGDAGCAGLERPAGVMPVSYTHLTLPTNRE